MTEAAGVIFQCPPFPDATAAALVRPGNGDGSVKDAALLVAAMRRRRVGGKFWLPEWSSDADQRDPWARRDTEPLYSAADPRALLDAITGKPVQLQGEGAFARLSDLTPGDDETEAAICALVREHLLSGLVYHSPFTGDPIDACQLVDILGDWRDLIDANRPIAAAFGFAHWKRDTVDPLLWAGSAVPFLPATPEALKTVPSDGTLAVWKARVPAPLLAEIEAGPWRVMEVEDGFIRSAGLGADCVPPLSIVADDLGVHYDPSRPNRLEDMLAQHDFSPDDLARARRLRDWIVREGVSKYGVGSAAPLVRVGGNRRHLLVVGQVEDDRSVLFGGGAVRSNLELLRRVRAQAPDAWIVYRPHPDVEAGHRRGAIPQRAALDLADAVDPDSPISALIAMADEVHVITSLAGFEALLQSKAVTTHGTPFFAGWGLTCDLGAPIGRRVRKRSIDELVAAVLLRYPRYLDPVTNLPCTAEILVMRLISGVQRQNVALVPMRRLVGWARRVSAQILGSR